MDAARMMWVVRYALGFLIPLGYMEVVVKGSGSGVVYVGLLLSLIIAGSLFATWWAVLFLPPVMIVGTFVLSLLFGAPGGDDIHLGTGATVLLLSFVMTVLALPTAVGVAIGKQVAAKLEQGVLRRST
jgi:hypothetical protein